MRMRINRLFTLQRFTQEPVVAETRHAKAAMQDGERRACDVPDGFAVAGLAADNEDLRGENAVLGLIGSGMPASERVTSHERGAAAHASEAHDIIGALHDQYCKVLDDPYALLANHWAADRMAADEITADTSAGRHDPLASINAQTGSIDELLSGERALRDVFGPLNEGQTPESAQLEPVPDVLRLFAPAGYLAAAARRSPSPAPSLARREHHSLAIDSPLFAPASTLSREGA
jgi:hypothetical protein